MQWSTQQQQALDAAGQWLAGPEQTFYLAGYAGTGKTTLARHLAELQNGTVLFGAFTGKAAHVLRQRGCPGATTIHRLIYKSHEKGRLRLRELEEALVESTAEKDGVASYDLREKIRAEKEALKRPFFSLNPDSEVRNASLLVIDEVSMIDDRMGQDLLSFGTKVLVLGDPAQLPPVMGGGYFTGKSPNIMLTEIHRQAAGNPIIDMATKVRKGETLDFGEYGESEVMDWGDIIPEDTLRFDQILVGKNRTRRGANNRVRELMGLEGRLPLAGDRLVCLRNDHALGLLNGAIWIVDDTGPATEDSIYMDLAISPEEASDGDALNVASHTAHFLGFEIPYYERRKAQEFDYGYALTCHKAQGSQWDSVLVFDESRSFKGAAAQWLYTAITRAAKRVTIAR